MEFFVGCIAFVAMVVGLVAGIAFGVRALDHPSSVSSCRDFALATGYETRFVDNNLFDYGCRLKTNSGNWVAVEKP